MAYVVQAEGPGSDAVSLAVQSPHEALEMAFHWRDAGHAGVRIIGDGRVFMTPEDFAAAIIHEKWQPLSMDHERKTLAEFSQIYLQSLETPATVEAAPDDDDAAGRFAARVALVMRRGDQERPDR